MLSTSWTLPAVFRVMGRLSGASVTFQAFNAASAVHFFLRATPSKVESIMHEKKFRMAMRLLSRREKVRFTMMVASAEGKP